MSAIPDHRLQWLQDPSARDRLTRIGRGIEKESLRITEQGRLAQTPHPATLGSALTHHSITTDFSEALLELITPVHRDVDSCLEELAEVHAFVYQNLDGEMLWNASMPCVVSGDDSIPIARYGSSNVARMKEVYREGLGHRYGRIMQAIAGIHYNFSLPEDYWQAEMEAAGVSGNTCAYITGRYLDLIRNFRRHSWLLIYLFGASPAVCGSFLKGRDHQLQAFDEQGRSMHLPYATALRMGDLGYQSNAQKSLHVCYNSLDNYIHTLGAAIREPHAEYAEFSSGQNGDYQQLSDCLLQIENEFYSPIRPKRVANSGEIPLGALRRAGVQYIEVRCLDVNPFTPLGLDAEQIRFVDAFLLYCLWADSPQCDESVQAMQAANLTSIVNRGREPGLTLQQPEGERPMRELANELLDGIAPISELLDKAHGNTNYSASLSAQRDKVADSELTPSARTLREMREKDLPFFRLGMTYAQQWAEYFRSVELPAERADALAAESRESLARQREVEAHDDVTFPQYLQAFYDQYNRL